ncbi:MAG: ATP-grasp domain-containing protein [bacterium]|nr:ATP-grasp domain-containing protein [bacterium]
MKKILIITGPAGDAQGWGNMAATQDLCDALNSDGKSAEIAFVKTMDDFNKAISEKSYDIVWSALYYISEREDIIGLNVDDDAWLADIFDKKNIPYIGPDAQCMKNMIDKHATHSILREHNVAVPDFHLVGTGDAVPDMTFPAFVKPSSESRSVGISDDSVVHTPEELANRINYVQTEFEQPALVESFLPGKEYTVLMLGNGKHQEFLPGLVITDEAHYGKYRIFRNDMRGVGITKVKVPDSHADEANELCRQAVTAMDCKDHVRVDMRFDADEKLRIIEVNGIPGLKPVKSWSPQLFTLYHPSKEGPEEDYRQLVHRVAESGMERFGLL